MEVAFLAVLDPQQRAGFDDVAGLAATLARLRDEACAAHPDVIVEAPTFAAELARRLGALASQQQLARLRADDLHLAIACVAGDADAIQILDAELVDEVARTGARLRARADQIDDIRAHLRRVLFVSEPGRPAALAAYSGRGDLRSYLRVMATRELVRVINRGRREVGISDDALLELVSPQGDPQLAFLRDHYRADVDAAMRVALAGLSDAARALLRYSLLGGWTVDKIGALYGIHRATAARRVAAAREELAVAIRTEVAARLAISVDEVDSIVRMVQSRIDLSLERLLG